MNNKMETEELVHCYNKGCGIKFKPADNYEDSCCFHPGGPIFHDAYKGWSCCNKRSTDFTTFLNLKGCTKGKHNPVKPPEPTKNKPDPALANEVISVMPPKPKVSLPRPDFESKMEKLKVIVTPSLLKEEEKEVNNTDGPLSIPSGQTCQNNGCKTSFEADHSNLDLCTHHPGVPVFHEGLKFWSCCQRRTSDFDVFLQQEGCTVGSHVWHKKDVTRTTCRYDWHQTATHIFVTIYAKSSRSQFSPVDVNPVRLTARIVFAGSQQFDIDRELGGVIIPSESCVTFAATKVEIKLRKAEPKQWIDAFLPLKEDKKPPEEEPKPLQELDKVTDDLDVENIDLNDI